MNNDTFTSEGVLLIMNREILKKEIAIICEENNIQDIESICQQK